VGASADPPQCAVDAMARWGATEGGGAFPQADALLILADAGGRNGCRPRQWKPQWQEPGRDRFGLPVTGCHSPTGCSKWHPRAPRVLSQSSSNWAGQPLRTVATMLGLIRGTSTRTGLTVSAHLLEGVFETGKKVTDAVLKTLNMARHAICPQWNSTIRPVLVRHPLHKQGNQIGK
jgi:hypothetical protein